MTYTTFRGRPCTVGRLFQPDRWRGPDMPWLMIEYCDGLYPPRDFVSEATYARECAGAAT